MLNKIILYLKKFDWILFTAIFLLICFGLAEIYSIALSQGSFDLSQFNKQLIFIIIGLILLFIISFIDYYNLRSYGNYIYIFGVILLVGVLIFGKTVRGTTGWYDLWGISIQPSEIVKIILIIFLARYFSRVSIKVNPLKHLIISGSGCLLFVLLVLKQPDFGSALILFLLWVAMVAIAGINKKYIILIGLTIIILFFAGWQFFFKEYQKRAHFNIFKSGREFA